MEKTKKTGFGKDVGFYIFLGLLSAIYAVVLELSKNTIVGWGLFFALLIALIWLRITLKKKEKWNVFLLVGCLGAYIVLLLLVLRVTAPPVRAIAAVPERNPEATDVVRVKEGELTGVYTKDKGVRVYAGIPYAAAPVGERRFQEPQPAEPWDGVRACDTFGPMAMQQRSSVFYNSLTQILGTHNYEVSLYDHFVPAMSEDCLYLNIWAPADAGDEPLPVLFFIHGGSLMTGESYYSEYRGEDLARQGIIVVNFAYRLGVFGYYANEELEEESEHGTTGDYGLLDQIAALQWVHDNITSFGGDPEKVTIAGESAGSSSVNALCVSPLTEGLFRYAIGESSSICTPKPYHTFRDREEALAMGEAILEEMGAHSVDELREVPAETLVKTGYQNSAMMIDGYAITEQPYLTYLKNENHEQALLNGFNGKEADAFLLEYEATAENYEELLEPIVGEHAAELAALVPPGSVRRDQSFIIDQGGDAKGALCEVYSAAWFTYSHHVWSDLLLAEGRPVYEYYFMKENNVLSNYHAGELPYAYGNLWRHRSLYQESDFTLSETMQKYWVNFVKNGDPNGENVPEWEAREEQSERVLNLDEEIYMTEDPYVQIYEILDEYQEELSSDF